MAYRNFNHKIISMHENILGMIQFLGANVGERNDSSWLKEIISLQEQRYKKLIEKQQALIANLPSLLLLINKNIQEQIANLQNES